MTISIDSRILHLKQLYAEIQQKISTIYEYLLLQASDGRYVDHQKEQKIKLYNLSLFRLN
jgi:hypothetical protein